MWVHVHVRVCGQLKKGICVFSSACSSHIFRFLFFVLHLYNDSATCWAGERKSQYYTTWPLGIRINVLLVIFYSSLFLWASHFHAPLICVFGQWSYFVTEHRGCSSGNFLSVHNLNLCRCVCVYSTWQTHCLGTVGDTASCFLLDTGL